MPEVPRLVVSATRGGLGKTTLTIGITAAWRKQGRRIAVFKKGPDFIDAGWLGVAAGRPCYNLDLFIMEQSSIVRSFIEHTAGMDAAIIEGNRGLFDGVDESGTYSTARLAKLLKIPVVLIVDCTKASSTVGAVVLGCRQFDPEVVIGGVILNNVSLGRHESVIRKAIEQSSGLPVLGAVPRQRKGEFPERHMGLTPFHEHPEVEQAIAASAAVAEKYLDLDALWNIACDAPALSEPKAPSATLRQGERGEHVTIGIIKDTAFQFYYPDNLEALEGQGARLKAVNALKDRALPDIDALYIGGGFPETQAAELAANESFCRSVREAAEQGLPIYAECGGLIYLGRSLTVGDKTYPMTAVLPADFVLEKKPQAHGYTVLEAGSASAFLDNGVIIRGHEFHYSRIVNLDVLPPMAYHVTRGGGINGKGDGLVYKNVLAAYTHIHSLGTPEWASSMVKKAHEYRNGKKSGKRVLI
jgi:cobyrinic acid a,c-diamide synthase